MAKWHIECKPGLEVIKRFFQAQLSMKFQLRCGKFRFKTQELVIHTAHKC